MVIVHGIITAIIIIAKRENVVFSLVDASFVLFFSLFSFFSFFF